MSDAYVVIKHTPGQGVGHEIVGVYESLERALDKRRAKLNGSAGEWYESVPGKEWSTRNQDWAYRWYPFYTATKAQVT